MLEKLSSAFSGVVKTLSGKSTITEKNIEDTVEQIKMALLEADVNLRVVRRFVNSTIEEAKGEKVLKAVDPGQQFVKIIYDKIVAMLGDTKVDLHLKGPDTQSVILMLGLQGAGKTTAAHKLAAKLLKDGRKPLLAACDLVRPAAVEQLSQLGEKIGVPVFKENSKDAVKNAKEAIDFARRNGNDTIIIDTAGRLQIDEEMMAELVKIKKVTNPVEVLLVADAMTGQNAVDIAKSFDEQLGLTGVILTKFDSDARGGAALSLKTITGKPISRFCSLVPVKKQKILKFSILNELPAVFLAWVISFLWLKKLRKLLMKKQPSKCRKNCSATSLLCRICLSSSSRLKRWAA